MHWRPSSKRFQSAPLTEARGDGDRPRGWPVHYGFQSAPLTEARGDSSAASRSPGRGSFNPLPSPKQGETSRYDPVLSDDQVSIRSPHRSKGRRRPAPSPVRTCSFQSAPLTEARGDLSRITEATPLTAFQSAPLTEARGDLVVKGWSDWPGWFQSAPLTEARGDPSRSG